jgi:hypothetical protein
MHLLLLHLILPHLQLLILRLQLVRLQVVRQLTVLLLNTETIILHHVYLRTLAALRRTIEHLR